MLTRLMYKSRPMHPAYSIVDIEILEKSREFNSSAGITGFLFRSETNYLQFIEGPRKEIRALADRIKVDSRHSEYCEVPMADAPVRSFENWSMGFLDMSGQEKWIMKHIGALNPACDDCLKAQFIQSLLQAALENEGRL